MLDVHPPHSPAHTWKDFFTHIATIVVGLLIAVGLEQTVESIHHHREAEQLREDLHSESQQILADSRRTDVFLMYEVRWLDERIRQVQDAVYGHSTLAAARPNEQPYYASPDIPIWRSAKSSGVTPLLSKGEVNAFAEIEYVQTRVNTLDYAFRISQTNSNSFTRRFPSLPGGQPDFSKASPEDMRTYLSLLTDEAEASTNYIGWVRILKGAETGVIAGQTNLEDIYNSERTAHAGGPE